MKRSRNLLTLALLSTLAAACAGASGTGAMNGDDDDDGGSPTPDGSATPTPGETPTPALVCRADSELFEEPWIDGGANGSAQCANEPDIQVQRVDANTFVLRQSMCTNYEGPFLYLLFGSEKVLLQDTGAGGVDVRGTVQGLIADWLAEHGRTAIDLVVVNSHGHGDHTAGNGSFDGQPDTTVVGTSVSAISTFFGITDWPVGTAAYDLGGRVIDVIPIPGHHAAHTALYDHGTGWLLTGDTLYPGRLYISDFAAYKASTQRMVDFTADKQVCQVMGTHIEMTSTAGDDFAFGSTYHPNEHALTLSRDHLVELNDAVQAMGNSPQVEAHDDFVISP